MGVTKLRNSLTPLTGVSKLIPSNVDGTTLAVLETSVIVDTSNIKIYFTKSKSSTENAICLATATTVNGTWTINPTPIIGLGYGGAPANRQAHSSDVVKIGSYYYCAATNGYGFGSVGEDRNIYLYRSTDGITFTDLGLILNKTSISGADGFGNVSIYPTLVNGKYEILVEASVGGIWRIFRCNTTNIESGWTYVNALPTLQVVSGAMYGGMQHIYMNGKWHILYHYGSAIGNLPTILGYAISYDLITCVIKESPFLDIEATPYGANTDQIADPFMFESNGNTYVFAEYCSNSTIFQSQIWMWTYEGTMNSLLK